MMLRWPYTLPLILCLGLTYQLKAEERSSTDKALLADAAASNTNAIKIEGAFFESGDVGGQGYGDATFDQFSIAVEVPREKTGTNEVAYVTFFFTDRSDASGVYTLGIHQYRPLIDADDGEVESRLSAEIQDIARRVEKVVPNSSAAYAEAFEKEAVRERISQKEKKWSNDLDILAGEVKKRFDKTSATQEYKIDWVPGRRIGPDEIQVLIPRGTMTPDAFVSKKKKVILDLISHTMAVIAPQWHKKVFEGDSEEPRKRLDASIEPLLLKPEA
ncbi:hypothetical protein OAN22_01545 [Alphaproteobacteria bacterium]|nr:hypothetical protein [Alphaproteobacteria bacterium]